MRRAAAPIVAAFCLASAAPAHAQRAPEPAREAPAAPVRAEREMAVTAHPLATEAAAAILARGGGVADAAIAAQAVLGLVEPQSSGMGGGAFAVIWDADARSMTTLDAREAAPMAATEARFLDADGTPLGFAEAWQSGLSVGVPGVPALIAELHARWGRLPLADSLEPARRLALDGFPMSERTSAQAAALLARNESCADRLFFRDPLALAAFADPETCAARPAGTVLRNPGYARLMARLAEDPDAFRRGPVAEALVAAAAGDPARPGDMTLADLAAYRVVERPPVCAPWRAFTVCGMGPPSSGGVAVAQILGLAERIGLGAGPLDPRTAHAVAQAGRLAFADRDAFLADPDAVAVPVAGLLAPDYLDARAALAGPRDMERAAPGAPDGAEPPGGRDGARRDGGTTHVSLVDRYGDVLSMTSSVESSFGNGVMVPGWGFLLNNQLTDFAFAPSDAEGRPVANRAGPGKRPRSSMAPTIVLGPEGAPVLATGSPGGSRIIGYTAQSILAVLAFGLDPQAAAGAPHVQNANGPTDLEEGRAELDALAEALEALGHEVRRPPMISGLSIIAIGPDGLSGGADPRRDGTAQGR